ncbi:hypothetical protein FKP32DRAFT_1560267 [Trametes sanguinea]|nr:hypothetical protein FKP32DRAFT_1560267 [Trametes sanguinea]
MRTELNVLGNAVVGIGNAVKVMVEQQGAVVQELKAVQEKQAAALVEMTHKWTKGADSRRHSRQARGEDSMDVDDDSFADTEDDPIPVRSRDLPRPKLQGPPKHQDPKRVAFTASCTSHMPSHVTD